MVLYAAIIFKGDPKGYIAAMDELETQLELIDNSNSVFEATVVKDGNLFRATIVTGQ